MSITSRRAVAVLSTAVVLCCTVPAASASAATADRGLLSGLLTAPAPVPVSTSTVTSLVTTIVPTTGLPTATVTPIVQNLLAAGVPSASVVGPLVTQVTAAVASGDPTALVSSLVAQGLDVGSIVPLVSGLLAGGGLDATTVGNQVLGSLLAVGLPTDAAGLSNTGLTGLLAALQGGALPTGDLLAPVAALFDTLAANAALPTEVQDALKTVSGTIRSTGSGVLPDGLLGQITGTLGSLTGAASLTPVVGGTLNGLAGLLVPKQATPVKPGTTTTLPGATLVPGGAARRGTLNLKDLTATLSGVKVDQARKVLSAKVTCPKTSFVPCTVKSLLSLDGQRTGKATRTTLKPGQVRTIKLKLAPAGARKLARRGGRVTVKATSSYAGYTLGSASKATSVKKRR